MSRGETILNADRKLKWYDAENAKSEFDKFPGTRKMTIAAFCISLFLALLEIVKLLIHKD